MKKILNELCGKDTRAKEARANGIYPYYRPISSGQDPLVGRAYLMRFSLHSGLTIMILIRVDKGRTIK